MASSWKDVRAEAVASGLIDEQRVENARKEMREEGRAYKLAEVRKEQHLNQTQLAASMNVSQARVSKIERGQLSRTELGTLQSYVEALGGHLRVVADFGDTSITVSND